MQDYIFNSRRKAHRRRRRMLFRLLLLIVLIAVGTVVITQLTELFTSTGQSEQETRPRDLLPLPPVEKTRPVSRSQPEPEPPTGVAKVARKSQGAEAVPAAPSGAPRLQVRDRETVLAKTASTSPTEPTVSQSTASAPVPPQTETTIAETAATAGKNANPGPDTETKEKPQLRWREHQVKSGESLAVIFKKMELPPALLHQIINSSTTAKTLALLKPGQLLRFGFDAEDRLVKLTLERNRVNSLEVTRTEQGFSAEEINRPVTHRIATAQGSIVSSLFVDGQKAGLTDGQIMELANLFGWDIDFALELRKGDRFSVIYQENWLDGEKLGNGPILAAEFVNQGKVYRAIRYTDSKGETAYYDTEGNAKRRAFIRTPVKFTRISSRFTRKRWHPVLKRWRSHKGVDYAAPKGTPVKATGNGKVTFIGRKGGYGKVIFLRHGGRYTTVYGHLSRFAKGLRTGSKVKQGQVIGYVGQTGLATGPHLHYEFRINGVHRNPLTVKLPKSIRLPKKELARFRSAIQPMVAQLDELRAQSMVASAATP